MDNIDSSESDEGIELVLPILPISQEDLAPLSGSVLVQPRYTTTAGLESQLSIRMAATRRQNHPNNGRIDSNNGLKTLSSFIPVTGMSNSVEDVWKTHSDLYSSHDFTISSPLACSEPSQKGLTFSSPLAIVGPAAVVQSYLSFAAFTGPLPIDHIMIPETMEEDILGEGVTFVVTESLLQLPLLTRSKNYGDLVALKRVKAPQYLLEKAEKQRIEKVYFELRVLLHETIRHHANIVDIICIAWEMHGSDPRDRIPCPVLVMEHAAFGALSSYQVSNPLTWDQKRRICLEVACGLEVLHNSGIIHGDVKSENVLLFPCDQQGFRAKLSDFGCSLLDDDYDHRILVVGTRIWSAPETLSGPVSKEWASKTDVYSFGLLSFRICMDGRNPFWALPIFDLDPDLLPADTIKKIQELKLMPNFVEMCLEYAHHVPHAELPLAKIMHATLNQIPHQRKDIKDLVQVFQFKIQDSSISNQEQPSPTSKRLSVFTPSFIGESPLDIVNCMVLEHNYRRQGRSLPYEVKRRIVTDLLQLAAPLGDKKCDHCCQKTIIDTKPEHITFEILVEMRNEPSCVSLGQSMDIVRACEAAFELSYCWADGFGTDKSPREALQWMRVAASNGLTRAQAAIVPLYESFDQQVPSDMPSFTWLYNGMMKGSVEASYHLSSLHPTFHALAREVYLRCERGIGRSFWIDQHPERTWPVGNIQSLVGILGMEGYPKGQVPVNDHYGDTLLHLAAATGYPQTVEFLCGEFEHPVNARNHLGETALLAACRSARVSTVDVLLAHGAEKGIASELNAAPLHWLMAFERFEEASHVCKKLLSPNLTLEIQSDPQQLTYESCTPLWFCGTPLHWAVTARNIAAVMALVLNGASPTSQNSRNETPLQAAAALNFHAALKFMLPRCKDADLISLCEIGTMEIPMFFHRIQFGARWMEKMVDCVKELLSRATGSKETHLTNTLFTTAIQAWYGDPLDCLLNNVSLKPIFHGEDGPSTQPLVNLILEEQYSSFAGYLRIYFKFNVDISNRGHPLLKAAASVNDPRFIKQLLDIGMSPYDKIHDGLDAFGVAVMSSSFNTADAILEFDNASQLARHCGATISECSTATLLGHILSSSHGARSGPVYYLIEHGTDAAPFIALPEREASVFHVLAAQVQSFHRPIITKDYRRTFQILVRHFTEEGLLDAVDISGETALHYAVEAINFEAVVALLQAGAELNHHGKGVDTALDKAYKILEAFLLKHGSSFELPHCFSRLGIEGKKIAEKRLDEIIELLRVHGARTITEIQRPESLLTPSLGQHVDPERLSRNDLDYYMESGVDTDLESALNDTIIWEERLRKLYLS